MGVEHLIANGWHLYPSLSKTYLSRASECLQKMSCSVLKELSGNGLSLPAFTAWLVYVFSRIVPVMEPTPELGAGMSRSRLSLEEDDDSVDDNACASAPSPDM